MRTISPTAESAAPKVVVTGPELTAPGGVSSYFNAILPALRAGGGPELVYFPLGASHAAGAALHPVLDQIRLRRVLRSAARGVLHSNPSLTFKSFVRDGVAIAQAQRLGLRTVVFFHGWNEDFADRVQSRFLPFLRLSYGRADRIMVLASRFRDRLQTWGVRAPIDVAMTAVADDLAAQYDPTVKQRKVAGKRKVSVLYMARFDHGKGVLETLEAFARLRQWYPKVELTLAGDGPLASPARHRAAALGLQREVQFTGYVRGADKIRLLQTHDVYCFPTQYGEGLPISLLEAMAFGMPVVTSPQGGIADFFQDGRMGSLLATTEPEAIARAMATWVSDSAARRRAGEYNRQYAERFCLGSAAAASWLQLYREFAGGRPGRAATALADG